MPLVPHRVEPMVMSINLAQKTRDPKRMADAVESLLSLGWPGQDEYFRLESANQVETLAKVLREDGKGQEADQLLAKLTESQSRDLFVRLSWDGDADFDLLVDEPLGATASYQSPRTVFGGSILKNGYGSHPEEVYVCPRGFAGDYTIRVSHDLHQPRQAGHSLDAGNDHARRDDRGKETDDRPQPRQAEQAAWSFTWPRAGARRFCRMSTLCRADEGRRPGDEEHQAAGTGPRGGTPKARRPLRTEKSRRPSIEVDAVHGGAIRPSCLSGVGDIATSAG